MTLDERADNLSITASDAAMSSFASAQPHTPPAKSMHSPDAAEPTERAPVPSSVSCTIDLDGFGKSTGHVVAPWSRDESGWGNLLTPIAVIANGEGPTVLLTGGNHGDEFEGPVALRRLVHALDADDVAGRIIVVPGLNHAALRVGKRLSPIDGVNMRSPALPTGRSPNGSPTSSTASSCSAPTSCSTSTPVARRWCSSRSSPRTSSTIRC